MHRSSLFGSGVGALACVVAAATGVPAASTRWRRRSRARRRLGGHPPAGADVLPRRPGALQSRARDAVARVGGPGQPSATSRSESEVPSKKRLHYAYAADAGPVPAEVDGRTATLAGRRQVPGQGVVQPAGRCPRSAPSAATTGEAAPRAAHGRRRTVQLTSGWTLRPRTLAVVAPLSNPGPRPLQGHVPQGRRHRQGDGRGADGAAGEADDVRRQDRRVRPARRVAPALERAGLAAQADRQPLAR